MPQIYPYSRFFTSTPILPNISSCLAGQNEIDFDAQKRWLILRGCHQVFNLFFNKQNLNEIITNLATLRRHSAEDIDRMIKNSHTLLSNSYCIDKLLYLKNNLPEVNVLIDEIPSEWADEGALFVILDETIALLELLYQANENNMIISEPNVNPRLIQATFIGMTLLKRQYYSQKTEESHQSNFTI